MSDAFAQAAFIYTDTIAVVIFLTVPSWRHGHAIECLLCGWADRWQVCFYTYDVNYDKIVKFMVLLVRVRGSCTGVVHTVGQSLYNRVSSFPSY